jgi:predicted transcriptional regulator
MMAHKRTKNEILADILSRLREPVLITHVMYGANLSYAQIQRYIRMPEEKNVAQKNSDNKWVLTEKGRSTYELLQTSRALNDEIERVIDYEQPTASQRRLGFPPSLPS